MVIEQTKNSLGYVLRQAREQHGLQLDEVASQIKIHPRQLAALEAEDFAQLPNMTFVRGFVRSYAKCLHLDATPLLAMLPDSVSAVEKPPSNSMEVAFSSRFALRRRQNLIWLSAAACVVIAAVTFAVWSLNTPTSASVEAKSPLMDEPLERYVPPPVATASVAASEVLPVSAVATPPVVLENPMLRLVFDEDSWTEIREQSGKVLISQLNRQGTELRLDGHPPFSLVIGNAGAVSLYYKGEEIDLDEHLPHPDSSIARLKLE